MTSKERFLAAIERRIPDRLPVTTHHVMPYFLDTYMNGMSSDQFFDEFGLDPIRWTIPFKPDPSRGEHYASFQEEVRVGEHQCIVNDSWRIDAREIPNQQYYTLLGDEVCMIGGFNQSYYFQKATPEETRAAVRKCFEQAGEGGGYILAPSDHFFDVKLDLLQAFADEARKCTYYSVNI